MLIVLSLAGKGGRRMGGHEGIIVGWWYQITGKERRAMKKRLGFFIFVFAIFLTVGNHISFAETFHSSLFGLSIDLPDDWSKRQPKYSRTLFKYAKLGSGENLNMNVLSAEGIASIKQVPLRQTFHPYYDYVIIL